MIVFLTVAYCVILGVLVRLKVVPLNLWWKLSPVFFAALPDFLRNGLNRERWHWRFDTPEKRSRMVKDSSHKMYGNVTQFTIAARLVKDILPVLLQTDVHVHARAILL